MSSVPANTSYLLPACSNCHSSSAPSAGRASPPVVQLSLNKLVLQAGETTAVSLGATGGVTGTTGGFLCEATAGNFTAGTNSHINSPGNSITHSSNVARNWSFTYTAPSTIGPVNITAAVLTSNGSGSSGDKFSFSGFDPNATQGTPLRVMVLPAGVTNLGPGCADGYNNRSVLGVTATPTLGNAAFGFQMVGAQPNTMALIWHGINPAGFPGIDMGAVFGMFGCTLWVNSPPIIEHPGFTSAGDSLRAEGTVTFPLPLPNDASMHGLTFQSQAAYVDLTATTRLLTASLSNALQTTLQ